MRTSYRRLDHEAGPLLIDGHDLRVEEVVEVARSRRRVGIAEDAERRIGRCRVMIDVLLGQREKVYGLTTGFGKLRDIAIDPADVERLQANLIRSHAAGVGDPFPEDVVRAALLLRANTLCRGNSGVRLETVRALLQMLNDDVYAYVPCQGSVGASGDLAPLSHLVLVLMGDPGGRFYPRARRPQGFGAEGSDPRETLIREPATSDFEPLPELDGFADLAAREGWTYRPVRLAAKEGLALNNGTQFMTAIGCLTLYDAAELLRLSELAAAMSHEAHRGVLGAYDEKLHLVRPQSFQLETAASVRRYFQDSEILAIHLNTAHLQRASIALEDAAFHLDELCQELEAEGLHAPATVHGATAGVRDLIQRASRVLPARASGEPAASRLKAWAALPQREQIPIFAERLAPLRRHARGLIETVQLANFPRRPATNKVESALVHALDQLNQAVPDAPLVQDDYSFRCYPQVLGTAYRALWHVHEIVETEVNSVTDNPLLFPPEPPQGASGMSADEYRAWLQGDDSAREACRDGVIGGGNFHGEPVAVAMDYLAIAMAEVGNIAERRVAHLVDDNHSRGLPAFLIADSGLNSGFMIPQYTAAALVSENKCKAHPASVDSIPTSANTEDHVSMGTIAARKTAEIVVNVASIVAIELLAAYQGLTFRAPLEPGVPIRSVVVAIQGAGIHPYTEDRVMYPDLHAMKALMTSDPFLDLLITNS